MTSDSSREAVCAIQGYLGEVIREGVQPDDAQRRLHVIETTHPDVRMQLLWKMEPYDNSTHYDVIIRPKDGDTISISMCQNDALPWPLRGVQRWTEANLVQVNGRMLTMEEAVIFLDVLWNNSRLMDRMIDACSIREELERVPIVLADDELQSGMDGLRRTHQLYTAEETECWMQQRGMTQVQLEQLVSGTLTCAHLRTRITADRVAGYFESHRAQLDVAHIARIDFPDHDSASHLCTQAIKDAIGFASAMPEAFVSSDAQVRCTFSSLRRHEISSELEERLFAAPQGGIVGPIRVGSSYSAGCLLKLSPACYDTATQLAR